MRLIAVLLLAAVPVLDIKFKARGYFYAGSARRDTVHRLVRPGQLALLALPDQPADFEGYKAFKVMLVNETKSTAEFEAQDFRINIVREARDAAGRWRAIEYLPNSWCGNSYHRLYLRPGHHWTFHAPVYQGPFRTQMRFVLDQPGLHLVSNEFPGAINLDQFERKQGHSPVSIMDPYDD
jgi:hypothetical protein